MSSAFGPPAWCAFLVHNLAADIEGLQVVMTGSQRKLSGSVDIGIHEDLHRLEQSISWQEKSKREARRT